MDLVALTVGFSGICHLRSFLVLKSQCNYSGHNKNTAPAYIIRSEPAVQ